MYAPSKKIVYLLFSCIISLTLIYFAQKTSIENNKIISPEIVTSTSTDQQSEDIYNSKLAEISQDQVITPVSSSTTPQKPQTLTDNLTQNFFGKYLSTQSGGAIDDQSKEALVSSVVDQYANVDLFPDHFSTKDIITTSSLDKDSIKKYGNSFIKIEDDGVRQAKAISKDSDETKNLKAVGSAYKNLAINLSQLSTPDALAQIHLKIINNYYKLGEELSNIPEAVNDPVKILLIIKLLPESQPERDLLYLSISTFMKNSGILFDETEPGSYWLK